MLDSTRETAIRRGIGLFKLPGMLMWHSYTPLRHLSLLACMWSFTVGLVERFVL